MLEALALNSGSRTSGSRRSGSTWWGNHRPYRFLCGTARHFSIYDKNNEMVAVWERRALLQTMPLTALFAAALASPQLCARYT